MPKENVKHRMAKNKNRCKTTEKIKRRKENGLAIH
jgi:hypothetical protein